LERQDAVVLDEPREERVARVEDVRRGVAAELGQKLGLVLVGRHRDELRLDARVALVEVVGELLEPLDLAGVSPDRPADRRLATATTTTVRATGRERAERRKAKDG